VDKNFGLDKPEQNFLLSLSILRVEGFANPLKSESKLIRASIPLLLAADLEEKTGCVMLQSNFDKLE
jgi:hypothetical protein